MATTDRIFGGGGFTLFGKGTAATDGAFNWDGTAYAISAVADGGGGTILVTCADHGGDITVGSKVTITGTTDYDGTHVVTAVPLTTNFKVTETWNVTRTGSAEAHRTSNWLDENGIGTLKPAATDKIILSEQGRLVPDTYDNSSYPHEAGHNWCISDDMDQSAIAFNGYQEMAGYTGGVYEYNASAFNDDEAVVQNGSDVTLPCDAHPFAVGDYVTIAGTVNYNGQFRVTAVATNTFDITHDFVAENVQTDDYAYGRRPLLLTLSTGYTVVKESNTLTYIEVDGAADIEKVVHNSESGYLHLSSDGTREYDSVWVTNNGTLDVANDTELQEINVTVGAPNATIVVGTGCQDSGGNAVDLNAHAGNITWDSKIGQTLLNGATITYGQNSPLDTDIDIDKLTWYNGIFKWYGKSAMKDLEGWGGTVTAYGAGDKTIGSAASTYNVYDGTLDLSQAQGRVTMYSGADIANYSSDLKVPKQANVAW